MKYPTGPRRARLLSFAPTSVQRACTQTRERASCMPAAECAVLIIIACVSRVPACASAAVVSTPRSCGHSRESDQYCGSHRAALQRARAQARERADCRVRGTIARASATCRRARAPLADHCATAPLPPLRLSRLPPPSVAAPPLPPAASPPLPASAPLSPPAARRRRPLRFCQGSAAARRCTSAAAHRWCRGLIHGPGQDCPGRAARAEGRTPRPRPTSAPRSCLRLLSMTSSQVQRCRAHKNVDAETPANSHSCFCLLFSRPALYSTKGIVLDSVCYDNRRQTPGESYATRGSVVTGE